MEYYNNRLCVSYGDLVDGGIMSKSCYNSLSFRKRIDIVRRGGGTSDCCALVAVDSLPSRYREEVESLFPCADDMRLRHWVLSNYVVDQGALAYFHDRGKVGFDLSEAKISEYIINASVLNCCILLYDRAKDSQRLFGGRYDWDKMADVVALLRNDLHHTLPTCMRRFRSKVGEYRKEGYACLVSKMFGNQNTRKINFKIERLVLGIAVLPNKPFNCSVHEMYLSFVSGELDVYDPDSGELFSPRDFVDKSGEPVFLSESSISNILNKPVNKALIERNLMSYTTYYHEQMPHVHRHSGEYSLSQISMDDVDLTRKLEIEKKRIHAYYAYDVVSGCVVGASYGRKKDDSLVTECFRDMFRLIEKNGWNMPAGVEVENHLMTKYKGGFLKAGNVFKFVRFCAPQNSQEKYAEPMNGAKKKKIIHKNHASIGRFYGKGKWRVESQKISSEDNDLYEDKEYFSYEQLVADDKRDTWEWNNSLHHNQKMFPNMTRWQVLCEKRNPHLKPLDKITLAKYIGEKTETSIRRNSTVRVAYEDWWLSSPKVLERLEPNNNKVTAHWLPNDEGKPSEVYLFQNGVYVDTVERVETFNRVMAEQTEEDKAKFVKQQKKIAKFTKYINDNKISKVGILSASQSEAPELIKPTIKLDDSEVYRLAVKEKIDEETLPRANYSAAGANDV